ncbi:MAG: O-methyltransferase [Anaerolineales bacterium]|nr:O-methyltransferase [Anaerolineales bacterium]
MDDLLTYSATQQYLETLVPPREAELFAMEAYAEKNKFPIIGPACGQYCYQLARILQAKSIFELGSGYGYSTAWFMKALKENGGGVVHHTVWDKELSALARAHLAKLTGAELVQFHLGEAVGLLKETPGPFDIIFNDIDKDGYLASLPIIKAKLRSGGVLIIDNMLWHGRIFNQQDRSEETQGVREFTRAITQDSDWVVSLAPMRDGMIVAYKK